MTSKRSFSVMPAFLLTACLFAASFRWTLAIELPVAIVTEVSGEGELLRDGRADGLRLLAELGPNAIIRLKKGARAVILYLKDGDQYALSGPGTFTLGHDRPLGQKQTAAPIKLGPILGKNGKPMQFKNVNLSQTGMVMRTAGRWPIPAKRPVAAVILAMPSLFEWDAIGRDVDYEFVLKDEKGNTLFARVQPENKLSPPEDVVLDAGTAYRWSVSARGANGARYLSVYTFRVADLDTRAEFNNFYPLDTATVAERVAFAAWLESKGLLDEAEQYWAAMSKRYGFAETRY